MPRHGGAGPSTLAALRRLDPRQLVGLLVLATAAASPWWSRAWCSHRCSSSPPSAPPRPPPRAR